ncbi:unnamed protein product [Moneuplotes crassus]|uniref:Uncharacterized protein n=1 Tax=Euplotes crassus TaxID=5936 RepID=A0AAD2D544_EUPCR|nr:unnamed protein product [Moneuplotes crassus]
MNHQHKISITQVSFSNDAYSVYTELYIFRDRTQNLFCIPISITTNGGSVGFIPKWCILFVQGDNFTVTSELYDGDERFVNQATITGKSKK